MKRRRTSAQSLALKSIELSVAAPQVVAHRVNRMLAAGPHLSTGDKKEFRLMHSEKVLAFYQSWMAMWVELGAAQFRAWRSMWTGFALRPHSPTRIAQRSLSRQIGTTTKLLNAGLGPVHAKALANARRLAR